MSELAKISPCAAPLTGSTLFANSYVFNVVCRSIAILENNGTQALLISGRAIAPGGTIKSGHLKGMMKRKAFLLSGSKPGKIPSKDCYLSSLRG